MGFLSGSIEWWCSVFCDFYWWLFNKSLGVFFEEEKLCVRHFQAMECINWELGWKENQSTQNRQQHENCVVVNLINFARMKVSPESHS